MTRRRRSASPRSSTVSRRRNSRRARHFLRDVRRAVVILGSGRTATRSDEFPEVDGIQQPRSCRRFAYTAPGIRRLARGAAGCYKLDCFHVREIDSSRSSAVDRYVDAADPSRNALHTRRGCGRRHVLMAESADLTVHANMASPPVGPRCEHARPRVFGGWEPRALRSATP